MEKIMSLNVKNLEELEQAISSLHGFLEEVVLSKSAARIDVFMHRDPVHPAEAVCDFQRRLPW